MFQHLNKTPTNDDRRNYVGQTNALIEKVTKEHGWEDRELTELAIISNAMLIKRVGDKRGIVGKSNIWYSTIGECGKLLSFVESQDTLDWKHRGRLIKNETLAPIETFFNQVRERVS